MPRMISIDDASFDAAGFRLDGDSPDGGARYWTSTEGDQVGLYLFQLRPDIGADLRDIGALRAFYRTTAARNALGILEVETFDLRGVIAVRTLLKGAMEPSGRTYVGALTLPFRDFSYVFRIQCNEDGVTGAREAQVLQLLTERGDVDVDANGDLTRWADDPYDTNVTGPLARNRADLEVYDAMFPAHALSRTRRMLDHLQRSVRLSSEVRAEPAFSFGGA